MQFFNCAPFSFSHFSRQRKTSKEIKNRAPFVCMLCGGHGFNNTRNAQLPKTTTAKVMEVGEGGVGVYGGGG